jgi:hypothetical protein
VRLRSAEDELETAQEQLAALPELPDLPVVPDPSSLASKLERALQEGDVEESLEQAGWEIRKREQAFERAAARLPLWSGSAEEALALVVPSAETIALFEKGLSEIENECGATESECDRLEHELRAAESELRSLTNSGQVPTELELSEAREHRESGWGLVRAAWLESSAPEEAVAAFAGETPPGGRVRGGGTSSGRCERPPPARRGPPPDRREPDGPSRVPLVTAPVRKGDAGAPRGLPNRCNSEMEEGLGGVRYRSGDARGDAFLARLAGPSST